MRAARWLLLAAAIARPAGAAPADPLWSNAVAAVSRAKAWSPGEMRLEIEMADDQGQVLDTWDNRYRISADADGALRTEVLSALHNGRDETQKERAAQAKRERAARQDRGPALPGFGADPFDAGVQDSLAVRRLEGTREVGGTSCVGFAFTLEQPKGGTVEGVAWLEARSGLPVELAASPQPLPWGAHELSTLVRYADGRTVEIRIEGSGSLLFVKRRFLSVVTLGGWFRRPGG
jgi:hypothetical protein